MTFTCTFDRPLTPGPLAAGPWTMRPVAVQRFGRNVVAAGNVVSGDTDPGLPLDTNDTINFRPPPFDLTALADAKPNLGFIDFPLTTVP